MNVKAAVDGEFARRGERVLIWAAPVVITLMFSVGGWWLGDKFEALTETQKDIIERVKSLETSKSEMSLKLQDHESRMISGKAARELFQDESRKQFEKLNNKMDSVNDRMGEVANSLGQLKAVLNERLPAMRNQQTGQLD